MPRPKGSKNIYEPPSEKARFHTRTAIATLAKIMKDDTAAASARVSAAKVLLDRGWGKAVSTHHIDVHKGPQLLKVINEIVHVHETREEVEFKDQTPLLELKAEDTKGNGSKKTH